MRKNFAMMALMMAGMGMAASPGGAIEERMREMTPEDRKRVEEERLKHRLRIMKVKGMKEWEIDGIIVLALNEKNAIRKVENIKRQLGI